MSSPLLPMLGSNLRSWVSSKGFWLVALAALLPLVFTGVWVGAHRADVSASGLTLPEGATEGDNVTLTALVTNTGPTRVSSFNATLALGQVTADLAFIPSSQNVTHVEALEPGESREIALTTTLTGGVQFALAFADDADVLGEVDEFNNQEAKPVAIKFRPGGGLDAPAAPAQSRGNESANATADFAVTSLTRPDLAPGRRATLEAVVENRGAEAGNVTVVLRTLQVFSGQTFPAANTRAEITLEPGESETVKLEWDAQEGAWWHEAWVEPPRDTRDAAPEDNHKVEPFAVDTEIPADFQLPKPPEKQTIKDFYDVVLRSLHLRLLIPLIALFYAGGVIADERDRGALPYILTRPLPRWLIPVTKFVASFLVAAVALVVGLVLTYFLLFQETPQGRDVGFLVTPILLALVTLFAYGALFTLMGVWFDRPYLMGLVWIIAWEIAAFSLVPWVQNLTLRRHVDNALNAWPLDDGLHWLPTGEGGARAILVLVLAGVALLAASSTAMKRREFEV